MPESFQGCDGLIFVVDSQRVRADLNVSYLEDMGLELKSYGRVLGEDLPVLFQVNKRDLPDIVSMDWVRSNLRVRRCDYVESVSPKGIGTMEAMVRMLELIREP